MIEESQYGKLYGFTREPFHPSGRIVAQELLSWTAQRMIHDGLSLKKLSKWEPRGCGRQLSKQL